MKTVPIRRRRLSGLKCSVADCRAYSLPESAVGMFTFPKEEKIRNAWIQFCQRVDNFRTDYARVCGHHFTIDDFEDGIQSKIMNRHPRRLKKSAIPNVRPTKKSEEVDGSCEMLELVYDRNGRLTESTDMEMEDVQTSDTEEIETDPIKKLEKLESEKHELQLKLSKNEEIRDELESMLRESENKVSELSSSNEVLSAKIYEQENEIKSLQEYIATLKKLESFNDRKVERQIANVMKGVLKKKEVIVVLRRNK